MGILTLSASTNPANVNLSAIGTLDWAQWGASTNLIPPDAYKLRGGRTITVSGLQPIGGYGNDPRALSWTDGDSHATSGTTSTGSFRGNYLNPTNSPFTFTINADDIQRIAYFYISGYNITNSTFVVSLSDGSAPQQTYSLFTANAATVNDYVVQVNYQANTGGQALLATWQYSAGGSGSSVNIQGVATALAPLTIYPSRIYANGTYIANTFIEGGSQLNSNMLMHQYANGTAQILSIAELKPSINRLYANGQFRANSFIEV